MAKFTPGPMAASISGSIGGTTFSHNRGGPYTRRRAIPSNPSSSFQLARRAALATISQQWSGLTAAQRQAWLEWARQNPIINTLGNSVLLSGEQAYIQINSRLFLSGDTLLSVPPIVSAPPAFTSIVQDGDIGVGDTDLTFAAALATGNRVWLRAAIVNSAGVSYVKNLMKFVAVSTANQTSPWDNQAALTTRLGTLTVGQTLHVEAAQFAPATGLLSPFLKTQVVISTT